MSAKDFRISARYTLCWRGANNGAQKFIFTYN